MIAFDRGIDALEWCLLFQEVLMEVRQSKGVLDISAVRL